MKPDKREIKRVGIFSAVKTGFLLGGFGGFLLGIVQWILFSFVLSLAQRAAEMTGEFAPGLDWLPGLGLGGLGVFFLAGGGVGGAVIGVVFGLCLTWWYNLGASIWGGLEFEIVTQAPTATAPMPVRREPHGETALPRTAPPPTPPAPSTPTPPINDSTDSPAAPTPSSPA